MVTASTIPVLESKLQKLEQEHEHLKLIREKNEEVMKLRTGWANAKDVATMAKKAYDTASAELQDMINSGPPKADPQRKLPFAEDSQAEADEVDEDEDEDADTDGDTETDATEPVVAEQPKVPEFVVPSEIAALDITDLQKERLTKAGCKTLADVIDLGNKNWPDYPEGFSSLQGFGPKAISKLTSLLPSTAPTMEVSADAKTVRVKLTTFSGASPNLVPESEYDGTELPNGNVIIQLPGEDPVEFGPHEFEKVPLVTA